MRKARRLSSSRSVQRQASVGSIGERASKACHCKPGNRSSRVNEIILRGRRGRGMEVAGSREEVMEDKWWNACSLAEREQGVKPVKDREVSDRGTVRFAPRHDSGAYLLPSSYDDLYSTYPSSGSWVEETRVYKE